MSKKKDRAWFVSPPLTDLVAQQLPDDDAAARALHTDVKVIARLRQRRPMARSTLVRLVARFAALHAVPAAAAALIVDTRPH